MDLEAIKIFENDFEDEKGLEKLIKLSSQSIAVRKMLGTSKWMTRFVEKVEKGLEDFNCDGIDGGFKLLRNVQAGGVEVQNIFRNYNSFWAIVVEFIEKTPIERIEIQRVFEFICNFVTNNVENMGFIWNLMFPRMFSDIIRVELKNNNDRDESDVISGIVCMIIFHSICRRKNCLNELAGNLEFIELILNSFFIVEALGGRNSSRTFIFMIFSKLFSAGYSVHIYEKMKNDDRFSSNYLKMMYLLMSDVDQKKECLTFGNCRLIGSIFEEWMLLHFEKHLKLNRCSSLDLDEVLMIMAILGLMTCEDENYNVRKFFVTQTSLMKNLSLLLNFLVKAESDEDKEKELCWGETGLRKDLLMILGNLCFRNKKAQEYFRASGALVSVLNSIRSFDPNNPYIREWAIFCLRNLCENNKENQIFIRDLDFNSIVETSELSEMGYHVVYNQSEGNFSLQQSTK